MIIFQEYLLVNNDNEAVAFSRQPEFNKAAMVAIQDQASAI
jgi:hypothetical protein